MQSYCPILNLKSESPDQMQHTTERLCLDPKFFNYETVFYTYKVTEQNHVLSNNSESKHSEKY